MRSSLRLLSPIASCLALVTATGCGDSADGETDGAAVIEEPAGSYRGVELGATRDEVVDRFGQPTSPSGGPTAPLSTGVDTPSSPFYNCRFGSDAPAGGKVRYEDAVFSLSGGRVCGWITVEDGVATTAGVGIGDDLEEIADAYPKLDCGEISVGEGGLLSDPERVDYCQGRLAGDRYIWFGGDPVAAIQMNTLPLGRAIRE